MKEANEWEKMKVDKKSKLIIKNTSMLLLLNIAKLIFPFVTLPYLTRVLSTEGYGIVSYVKAVMSYMQVIIDFGFMLSATKQIVEVKNNKEEIGKIVGTNIAAKILLTKGEQALQNITKWHFANTEKAKKIR